MEALGIERIGFHADKSGMDSFWLNEASFADVRKAQPRAAAAQQSGAEAGAPFLTQVEQVLGEETVPDAEFFIDTWTVGIAAASENLLGRKEKLKSREHEVPAWVTFPSFAPWFVTGVETPVGAAWPLREARADAGSMAGLRWHGYKETDDSEAEDQVETVCPMTLESACRVLGVAATSTREQIRVAYRKMAGRYHPDRLAQCGASAQKLASDRMASVNQAYRLLCTDLAGRGIGSSVR